MPNSMPSLQSDGAGLGCGMLLDLDARRRDDLAPALDLALDVGGELLRRVADGDPALAQVFLLDLGRAQRLARRPVELGNDRGGCARPPHQPVPVAGPPLAPPPLGP